MKVKFQIIFFQLLRHPECLPMKHEMFFFNKTENVKFQTSSAKKLDQKTELKCIECFQITEKRWELNTIGCMSKTAKKTFFIKCCSRLTSS